MKQSAVVIPYTGGELLVLRRGPTDPWKPGHWNFPGGKIDPGENARQAAARELYEEAGIQVPNGRLRYATFYPRPGGITHVFLLKLRTKPAVRSNDGEHDMFHWCPPDSIPQPAIPGVAQLLRQLGARTTRGEVHFTRRPYMANPMNAGWPSSWPKMIPFPRSIRRSKGPVPNASSVDWPQAQFAPLYLRPGSPSFQPYSYLKNNHPLSAATPVYTAFVPKAVGPISQNAYRGGPGGDLAKLPSSYGDPTMATQRWGARPTGIPIASGVPKTNPIHVPEPIATAGLTPLYNGLALGALALENGCGCGGGPYGCSCRNPGENWFMEDGEVKWGPVLVTAAIGYIALNTFYPALLPKALRLG